MPNILINGVKSKTGGGKSIFQTYLKMAQSEISDRRYFVLTPDANEYRSFASDRMEIIDIPAFAKSNFAFPALYSYYFPKILKEYKIDAILNYGDIVVPGQTPQLYNFDWAYAAYPSGPSWDCLSLSERLLYSTKIYFLKKYLGDATIIMAQTDILAKRLKSLYGINNIHVVPNAVSLDSYRNSDYFDFDLPSEKTKLLYITFYYPHKNLEIFIEAAKIIKARNLPFCLVTTLSPDQHPKAADFLNEIGSSGLEEIIVNVGPVAMQNVAPLFEQCDGLLMPTLLESFSGSYVEAMFHKRPIFTSDLDFAKGVCADAAFYFDPLNAAQIADILEQAYSNPANISEMVERGSARLSTMWGWEQVFARTQELLQEIVRTKQ